MNIYFSREFKNFKGSLYKLLTLLLIIFVIYIIIITAGYFANANIFDNILNPNVMKIDPAIINPALVGYI